MFDINKIMAAANELGIEFKTNSSNPGFHFKSSDRKVRSVTFNTLKSVIRKEFNNNHSEIPYTTINKNKVINKVACNIKLVNFDINLNKNSLGSETFLSVKKIIVNNIKTETFNDVDISNLYFGNSNLCKVFENNKAA